MSSLTKISFSEAFLVIFRIFLNANSSLINSPKAVGLIDIWASILFSLIESIS